MGWTQQQIPPKAYGVCVFPLKPETKHSLFTTVQILSHQMYSMSSLEIKAGGNMGMFEKGCCSGFFVLFNET